VYSWTVLASPLEKDHGIEGRRREVFRDQGKSTIPSRTTTIHFKKRRKKKVDFSKGKGGAAFYRGIIAKKEKGKIFQ